MKAFICDLDGTLYDARERRDRCFVAGRKDFDRWNREAEFDQPHLWCAQLVQAMRATGYFPLFVTGREDTYREATMKWLRRNLNMGIGTYALFMRPAKNYAPDSSIKAEIYEKNIRGQYEVLFCVDDRQQVVDMWRGLGLTVLQCDVGNF